MRVILVPVADRPECVHALDAAFRLAQAHDANVVGCHVRGARAPGARVGHVAALALFRAAAARHGFEISRKPRRGRRRIANWHEMVGTPDRVLGIVGPLADLIVLSRPEAGRRGPARAFLEAALLKSSRAVLVLPQRPVRVGRRVLVAWSQRPETALAVTAALPILRGAERVAIAAAGRQDLPGPKASQLGDYLAHWGVRARILRSAGRNVRREVARALALTDSDLLVMGAYSRHRLRERLFGGMTDTMVFRADVPVLACHV